jgi:hypothetical protein
MANVGGHTNDTLVAGDGRRGGPAWICTICGKEGCANAGPAAAIVNSAGGDGVAGPPLSSQPAKMPVPLAPRWPVKPRPAGSAASPAPGCPWRHRSRSRQMRR